MKIKKLVESLPISLFRGSKDLEIKGLSGHSQRVSPGDLFLSRKSPKGEEEYYIDEAVAAGAVAVLTDFPNPARKNITQLVCENVREIESKITSLFYDNPSQKMTCIGATGTNGKTTSTFLIHHLLEMSGCMSGLIGTIEYRFGTKAYPAELTTPESITLQKCFKEMFDMGCQAVAMEVSSIGLDQGRVNEVDFDIALFTNLTQDHLDYHGTMAAYAQAKKRLFTGLKSDAWAVVNFHDPYSALMLEHCQARVIRYGFDERCDLWANEIEYNPEGTHCVCHFGKHSQRMKLPLLGAFNLLNALGALSVYVATGRDLKSGCTYLESFPGVPGRFQQIIGKNGVRVVIDYAHTPDAIERLCQTARETFQGTITLVVGAGGNRDKQKRPLMAKAAFPYADRLILTSDNPRMEDAAEICHQMAEGVQGKSFEVEIDRRRAIQKAIENSIKGDVILIAGKGHEVTQTIGKIAYPFDDRQIAEEYL